MKCPFCGDPNTQVTDTRENDEGDVVRRRRRCVACDKRFTTYERIDLKMPHIVKRNGARTEFDHDKLADSLKLALRKRPVAPRPGRLRAFRVRVSQLRRCRRLRRADPRGQDATAPRPPAGQGQVGHPC